MTLTLNAGRLIRHKFTITCPLIFAPNPDVNINAAADVFAFMSFPSFASDKLLTI